MILKAMMVGMLMVALTACIEASDDDDDDETPAPTPTPSPTVKTGVFLDSPVANVDFETATQSGTTNSDGEFSFVEGETVTFSIGEVTFPSATAGETVTPIDLAASTTDAIVQENQVVNILRLLQTLDSDGNPDNGITIADEAKTAATVEIDFTVATATFEQNDAVVSLITDGGQTTAVTALVSEADAKEHFEEQLSGELAGAWVHGDSDDDPTETDYDVLFFIEDGRYFLGHTNNQEPTNPDADAADQITYAVSGEYGTYTWDVANGETSVTSIGQSDGEGGLVTTAGASKTLPMKVSGDVLTGNDDGYAFTLQRVVSSTSAIVGSWVLASAQDDTDYNVIIFTAGGKYFVAHTKNTEEDAELDTTLAVSGEYGTYTWNAESGELVATRLGDSDGEGGLTGAGSSKTQTATVSSDGESLTVNDGTGDFTATRIGK